MNIKLLSEFREGKEKIELKDFLNFNGNYLIIKLEQYVNTFQKFIEKAHSNNFFLIMLVSSGSGYHRIADRKIKLTSKSLLVVNPNCVNSFYPDHNVNGYLMLFSEKYFERFRDSFDSFSNNISLFGGEDGNSIMIPDEIYKDAIDILGKIKYESEASTDLLKDEILYSIIKILLLKFEQAKRLTVGYSLPEYSEEMNDFKNILEENFNLSRSVQFYADSLAVSPKKLNRITQTHWGKSAKEVIENKTVVEIKKLLIYTDMTIKEISYSTGFNDPTNFNKFFKKFTDLTPLKFRELNK